MITWEKSGMDLFDLNSFETPLSSLILIVTVLHLLGMAHVSIENLRAVVKAVPLDRILLETDGPYHFPGNNPKAVNHSGTVPAIAATIARVKELSIEIVYHQIRQNTKDIYGI